jgi:hypothetical protein
MENPTTYTAFASDTLVSSGELGPMLRGVKRHVDAHAKDAVLIFEDRTGKQVDFDLRGSADEVVARALPPQPKPGPGRPKLGVTAREVTLLPRQWEWLEQQPQGASAALRRLVDEARKREPDESRARAAHDAAGKFMWAMAGNQPGFEEASRTLYAGDVAKLKKLIRPWPKDVRGHVLKLLSPSDGR